MLLAVIACSSPASSLAFRAHAANPKFPRTAVPPSSIQNDLGGRRPPSSAVPMTAAASAETAETAETVEDAALTTTERRKGKASPSGVCYYKRIDGSWKPRKELSDLSVGERLFATRLPECDLHKGKSGPKFFLECGVGRRSDKGKWNIVNGMVRMGRRGMKPSVARKKAKKNFPSDSLTEVYVSQVRPDQGRLEVCPTREEALERASNSGGRIPASSLRTGEELEGIIRNVTPYGVFVDVNANRNGLIHIRRVAERRNSYIAKEDGLKMVGLSRGAPVNVVVLSNERKRLELDLAPDAEEPSADDLDDADVSDRLDAGSAIHEISEEEEAAAWAADGGDGGSEGNDVGEDEAAMWAAYADSDEEDDGDDEDADIEDALGIGYY